MKLPHLNVLHWKAGSKGHAQAIASVNQCVGGRRVDAAGTTGGEYSSLRLNEDRFTCLDADCDDTHNRAVLILNHVRCIPFV